MAVLSVYWLYRGISIKEAVFLSGYWCSCVMAFVVVVLRFPVAVGGWFGFLGFGLLVPGIHWIG